MRKLTRPSLPLVSKDANFKNVKGPVLQGFTKIQNQIEETYKLLLKTLKRVVINTTYTKEVTDGQIVRRLRRIAIVVLENLLA